MIYINRKSINHGYVETVDEFKDSDWREAKRVLHEYQLSDYSASYYRSQRSTNEWRES